MRAFSYERAKSPAEAARAVAGTEGAKFLAGGTNLLDLMKLEVETPAHLVDVQDIGLDRIEPTDEGGLRIGTLVTNTALASHERVRRDYAVLTRAIMAGKVSNTGSGIAPEPVPHQSVSTLCVPLPGQTRPCADSAGAGFHQDPAART